MDTKSIGIVNDSILRGSAAARTKTDSMADKAALQDAAVERDFAVNLSKQAQDIADSRQKAMAIAKDTSPIREDLVASFKARIADGSYKVDPGKVADGILSEAIRDELATNQEI